MAVLSGSVQLLPDLALDQSRLHVQREEKNEEKKKEKKVLFLLSGTVRLLQQSGWFDAKIHNHVALYQLLSYLTA